MACERFPGDLLREYFARRNDIVAAYLFGSFAKGGSRATSDVDVAVLFEERGHDPFTRFTARIDISMDLEELLGRTVDVIDVEEAPLSLIYQVLRFGKLILERDHTRRITFEVNARRQYLDMLPYYDLYTQAMRKDLERGGFLGRRRGDPKPPEASG